MIATPFFPSLQIQSSNFSLASPTYASHSTGTYEDEIQATAKQLPSLDAKDQSAPSTNEDPNLFRSSTSDSLAYKTYVQKEPHYFVGISTETTYHNKQHLADLKKLWDYFYQNDISAAIPNIIDTKVYVIYSDFNETNSGPFNISIAFRTKDLDNIYEGLTGIDVPSDTFAVFEVKGDPEKQVPALWEKINDSNLPRSHRFDMEVYSLHTSTYAVEKVELRVSLK